MKPESARNSDAPAPNSRDRDTSSIVEGELHDDADTSELRVKKRRLGVDPSLIISDGRSKRRRTPSPEPEVKNEPGGGANDPKDAARATTLGRDIYQKIMDSVKDGENIAEPFIKLPSKRQFPDYYETIKHPMCLEMVKQKLDKQEYETLKEVVTDLGQIFNNAKRYNLKDSHLFQWAKKLHKMTRTFYAKVTLPDAHHSESEDEAPAAGPSKKRRASSSVKADAAPLGSADMEEAEEEEDAGGPSHASMDGDSAAGGGGLSGPGGIKRRGAYMRDGPTVYKLVKPVLKAIRDARSRDGMNREISGIFETLPDRRDLPDYYAAIKHPVSLAEIEERMMARRYDTWEEFFEQAELMCSNAMTYNEDDSDVFRDAQQIKSILDHHRTEIKMRLAQPNPMQKFKLKPPAGSAATPHRAAIPPQQAHMQDPYRQPTTATSSYGGYNGTSPYPAQSPALPHASSTSPMPTRQYLPPLPPGAVSDEIVSRLPQYPIYEQQAWASSLTPQGMTHYRQILANQEARRRIAAGQVPPPLGETAAAGRNSHSAHSGANGFGVGPAGGLSAAGLGVGSGSGSGSASGMGSAAQQKDLSYRLKPPLPLIKYLDFSFLAEAVASATSTDGQSSGKERHAIRLHNLRGVVTHALIVGPETTEIEITAILAGPGPESVTSGPTNANPTTADTSDTVSTQQPPPQPDVSLRVNGNPGSLAKFVYTETDIHQGDDADAKASQTGEAAVGKGRPVGMRWTVPIAQGRLETKLEVVCTKPGTGVSETCAVYVNRQF